MSIQITNQHLNIKKILVFVFIFSGCVAIQFASGKSKPNIILFFADDMGYGDLGCFGNPNIRTPHIDKLANDGMKCTSFYVAGSVCTPSRAALLSGRYPIHTLPWNVGLEEGFPADEPMIAEVLKKSGYRTMAIGKWHLGCASGEMLPTGRGFDHFYGLPYSNDMIKPWVVNTDVPLKLYIDGEAVKTVNYDQDSLTVNNTLQGINFIKRNKKNPFFLYMAYSMPHLPISTVDDFRGKSKGGLYGDVIETIDWSVGEIMETLRKLGLEENTLVIFSSDNGPWHNLPDRMLQRGVKPWHQGSAGLLRGAKASTWEGGMRVPGIFYWKGEILPGQVSSDIVSSLDLFPTLTELAGAKLPKAKKLDGSSLVPFLRGQASSPRNDFFYFSGRILEAVRLGDWKLRYPNASKSEVDQDDFVKPELFNLADDPGENYNRAAEFPEIVISLLEKMKKKAEEVDGYLVNDAIKTDQH